MRADPNLHRLEMHFLGVPLPTLLSIERHLRVAHSLEPSDTAKSDACYRSCFLAQIRLDGAIANVQEAITKIQNVCLGTSDH
jgi:hypothetical protein